MMKIILFYYIYIISFFTTFLVKLKIVIDFKAVFMYSHKWDNKRKTGGFMSSSSNRSLEKSDTEFKIVVYTVTIGLALLIIYPFIGMFLNDFGFPSEYGAPEAIYNTADPLKSFITNLKEVILDFSKGTRTAFMNSMIISVFGTVLCMYFSALTAYAITAYEWKLRQAFDKMIMIIVLIPTTVSTIGFYQMVWQFQLINKLSMLILPAIASPLTVFFIRLYLKSTFSKEIVESARLDGANEFRIFNQIMLPLMKPAIATQAMFVFVSNWHNLYVPRIILIDATKWTLPQTGAGTAAVVFLPPILVFVFLSRYIVEGISLGGVKN